MSWRASAYFKSLRICRNGEMITRSEKLVGLVLADSHQDRSGTFTYPSVAGIAEDSLMSERECRRVLNSLEKKGEIIRVRPTVQYRGVNTFYIIPGIDGGSSASKGDTTAPHTGVKGGTTGRKGDTTAPHNMGNGVAEGGQYDPLPDSIDAQKGGQKGDRRGTKSAPYKEEQEQEHLKTPPVEPEGVRVDQRTAKQRDVERRDAVREAVLQNQRLRLGKRTVWPPAADRALLAMLKNYPEADWPALTLVQCVQNRFASDVDPADPPQEWLGSLPRYISGAKDRTRRPKPTKSRAVSENVVPFRSQFAASAVGLIEKQPENLRIDPGKSQLVKDFLRGSMPNGTYSAWIDPLIIAYVKPDGVAVALAPSTQWDGSQEKYGEKINEGLSKIGLTNGFEMMYMRRDGAWSSGAA